LSIRPWEELRIHVSAIGGLSLARKIACCCEMFGVRTAWHGPGNVSPIGHTINPHLDRASYNFGIQEQNLFSPTVREVFPGTPEISGGYLYSNGQAGIRHRHRRKASGEVSAHGSRRQPRERPSPGCHHRAPLTIGEQKANLKEC
jgi:L-alanine-DL-glutamate epimerase-like enolase superfamily enzyme